MDPQTDSLIVFKTRQEKWFDKEVIGLERSGIDNFYKCHQE
jgi:CRISPR-associated protein Cas2